MKTKSKEKDKKQYSSGSKPARDGDRGEDGHIHKANSSHVQ